MPVDSNEAASGQLSLPQKGAGDCATLSDDDVVFMEGILRAAEDDPGLTLDGVDVRPACNIGDNFSSIVTRETAYGAHSDGSAYRRSVVVKRAPLAEMFRSSEMFWKEAFSYRVLVPVLRCLGEASRPPLPLPFAACLHASHRTRPNTIVLEDLQPQGFSMAARQTGVDAQQALCAMEALGRFHGASLTLRRTNPQAFRRLRAQLRELIYFREGEGVFGPSIRSAVSLAGMSLRRSGRQDLAERLAAAAPEAFHQVCDVMAPPPEGATAEPCFSHGDFWNNNVLFKHNQCGRVVDVRFLDMAGTRCASPAIDILHFMYTSLSTALRRKQQDALLQRYRESLQATVSALLRTAREDNSLLAAVDLTLDEATSDAGSVSAPELEVVPAVEVVSEWEVIPLASLRQELRDRAAFGLWHGLWMMPAIFFDVDCQPSGDQPIDYYAEDTLAYLCAHLPQAFHQRVAEHVEEFVDMGVL